VGGLFEPRSVVGLIDVALPNKRRQVLGSPIHFKEEASLVLADSERQEQIRTEYGSAVDAGELAPAVRLDLTVHDFEALLAGGEHAVDDELSYSQGV
jgi:hypothetical protein